MLDRGIDWEEKRKLALERDNYRCRKCKIEANNVHHIIPFNKSHNNDINNLITLCDKHHKQEENLYIRYGITGWMKKTVKKMSDKTLAERLKEATLASYDTHNQIDRICQEFIEQEIKALKAALKKYGIEVFPAEKAYINPDRVWKKEAKKG